MSAKMPRAALILVHPVSERLQCCFVSFIRLGLGPEQIGDSVQDDKDDAHFSMHLYLGVVYEQEVAKFLCS